MYASLDSPCFICENGYFEKIFAKGGKDYIQCRRCGLVRLHSLPTSEELGHFYEREYEQETGMGAALAAEEEMARVTARRRLGSILKYTRAKRWLDVGCSTGVFLDEVLKAGFDGCGIDLSKTAVERALARRLKAHTTTIEDFRSEAPFDVVTGFDIIEHVLQPAAFIKSAFQLLRPGGIIALTTPDKNSLMCRLMGRRWYFYIPDQHLFCFDRRNLSSLLERLGFHVLEICKALKAVTYNYSLLQFHAYNPLIYHLWKIPGSMIPPSWRQRPLTVYLGEMMVIARRAE